MIPPQRLFLKLLGKEKVLPVLKKGLVPSPSLMIPGTSNLRVYSEMQRAEDRNRLRGLSKALAIHVVADKHGVDPLEIIHHSASRGEAIRLTQSLNASLMADEKTLAAALLEGDFEQSYQQASQVAANLLDQGRGIHTGVMPWLRHELLPKMVSGMSNYGEEIYVGLMDPKPDQDYSQYVARVYMMDGVLTALTGSTIGAYADLSDPDHLAFQDSIIALNTHPELIVSLTEQIALHLGASAGLDYLSAGKDEFPVFDAYAPAVTLDYDRTQGTRGFAKDSLATAGFTVNLRRNNYLIGFGVRSWNQCLRLLQGFMLIGTGLRMLEPMIKNPSEIMGTLGKGTAALSPENFKSLWENFQHSASGQLQFIYQAPFFYRWVIAVYLQTDRTLNSYIRSLGKGYDELFTQLRTSFLRGDAELAKKKADELLSLYLEQKMKVPRSVLADLGQRKDEPETEWIGRLIDTAALYSPVPEKPNEAAKQVGVMGMAIGTTVLAMHLFKDTFVKRPFLGGEMETMIPGVDLTDWNFINGISEGDAIPAVMAKAMVMIWGIWAAGHGTNIAYDKLTLIKTRLQLLWAEGTDKDTTDLEAREKELVDTLKQDWQGLESIPGGKMLSPHAWKRGVQHVKDYRTQVRAYRDCRDYFEQIQR